jgi:O-antigen/teichoic acid export membrane protein
MDINRYINNVSSFQFYQVIRYASLLFIGIALAKSHLSTVEIGIYESILFLASTMSMFWLNGIQKSMLSLAIDEKDSNDPKSIVLFNTFIQIFIYTILLVAGLFFAGKSVLHLFNIDLKTPYFRMLLLYIFLSNPTGLIEYAYLYKKKYSKIPLYGLFTYAVHVILIIIPLFKGMSLMYVLGGMLLSFALRWLWLLFVLFRYARFSISLCWIKKHQILAFPLILSALLSGSAEYIDGLLVSLYFDMETFAIFRYGARELPITLLLANALSIAMIADFSNKNTAEEALKKLRKKSARLMHILFPLSIVLLLSSNWFYPLIFSADFSKSADIFNIYLLLIISRLLFPQSIITGFRQNRWILLAAFIEMLLNVFLSIVLIAYLGLFGIALATVIAYIVDKIVLVLINYKVNGIRPLSYIPLFTLLIYSLLLVITFMLKYLFLL